MSYLQMDKAPVPDMQKGIISFWFREVQKQQPDPPEIQQWPQGFWTTSNAGEVMVPPNGEYSVQVDPEFKNCVFYMSPYGVPIGGLFFGGLFLTGASVWIPNPPPLVTSTWSLADPSQSVINSGLTADTSMSKKGIRTLLTFGDREIPFQYASWRAESPDVIPAVQYLGFAGIVSEAQFPPYAVYSHVIGDNGLFYVRNYRLNEPQTRDNIKVPPSFIAIDGDGHLIINLQTKTKATYKGMAFELTDITELVGGQTVLIIPDNVHDYTYTELGFPFPDGVWERRDGFWSGYEFKYKDVSDTVMSCQPESFVIYSGTSSAFDLALNQPKVTNGGWHHVLFSFDISGPVHVDTPSAGSDKTGWTYTHPNMNTSCKAWLAFDDVNRTGANLQNRPPVHDGIILPKLAGTKTTQILDFGPCSTWSRIVGGLSGFGNMEPNAILPRNAWLRPVQGNPKDGLNRNASVWGVLSADDPPFILATANLMGGCGPGDYNPIPWTGAIWPLYGHGIAPGPWFGTVTPKSPSTPDVHAFDPPTYDCAGFTIPVSGNPIGIPCGADDIANNTGVEMAELQIWAGQTLDTGDVTMRRLFLDYPKDSHGNPDTTKPLQPVSPHVAEAVLGKPDILLHGSGNWKRGRNTGKTATDPDTGQPNPDGQFRPVSLILSFKPDPKLGK